MDWVEGLNRAVDYIEAHLEGELELEQAAKAAACSLFHFQRVFPYVAGVTLTEYIRRRRMTLAAFALTEGGEKVIDLAARFGYESPTAFNRAFQSVHGVSPTAARAMGTKLTAFPRISFSITIKGGTAMDYEIVKREGFRIVGLKCAEEMTMEDCFQKVPVFWEKVGREGWIPKLCQLMDGGQPAGILGVSTCDGGAFSGYYVAVATDEPCPEGMEEYTVPGGTWAVFQCVGPMPEAMQEVQQRIISEWLPTSGYEYAAAPDIEVYGAGDQRAPDCRSQVWLPIVKKA